MVTEHNNIDGLTAYMQVDVVVGDVLQCASVALAV